MDPLKREFLDLLRAIGWTQAETARQLCMTSGAVNQIVNPNSTVRPSLTTLRLFKLMVAAQRPEAVNPRAIEEKQGTGEIPSLTPSERKLLSEIRRVGAQELPLLFAVLLAAVEVFNSPVANAYVRKSRTFRKKL